jgi:putative membrane protein
MILHTIGSHYSYSEVPFGQTLGHWLNSDRNMYDRLVHFSFGFLMAYPMREVLIRVSKTKGFWSYYFPIDLVAAFSALYEIIEWLSVQNVSAELGKSFLGMQGDVWDAQKDMLLAITGACIMMAVIFIINLMLNKKAQWREFKESFKIDKDDKPLGEEKIAELLK